MFELHLTDPIRLRGPDKRLMAYDDTEFTRERRRQLDRVNAMLSRIAIDTSNPAIVKLPDGRFGVCPGATSTPGCFHGSLCTLRRADRARRPQQRRLGPEWADGRVVRPSNWPRATAPTILISMAPGCGPARLRLFPPRPRLRQVGRQLVGDAYAIPGWEHERKFVKRATVTAPSIAPRRHEQGAGSGGQRHSRTIWPSGGQRYRRPGWGGKAAGT